MMRDSRLSGVLHVLLHLAEHKGPVTSELLARAMQTNPVVIRRIMAGLKARGYVISERGHGGGWQASDGFAELTLRDVYDALGSPGLFAIGNRNSQPTCLVEQAVNAALDDSLAEAETLLLRRLGEVTLGQLSADFHRRILARGGHHDLEHSHSHPS